MVDLRHMMRETMFHMEYDATMAGDAPRVAGGTERQLTGLGE